MGNNQNSKSIEMIAFNRTEIKILRNNWQLLMKIGLSELGLGLMTRIMIENKELKCMFRKQNNLNFNSEFVNPNHSIKSHGEKVFNIIKIAINTIDDLTTMASQLNELGYKHFNYGTRTEHYQIMGEALISTLSDALKENWNEQTKKVWIKLFRIIEFQMKSGVNKAEADL